MKNLQYIIISILLCSCTNVERNISSCLAGLQYKNDTAMVDLHSVIDLDFDEIYVLGEYLSHARIAEILGQQYSSQVFTSECENLLILLKDNKIVHGEILDKASFGFIQNSRLNTDYFLHKTGPMLFTVRRWGKDDKLAYTLTEVQESHKVQKD